MTEERAVVAVDLLEIRRRVGNGHGCALPCGSGFRPNAAPPFLLRRRVALLLFLRGLARLIDLLSQAAGKPARSHRRAAARAGVSNSGEGLRLIGPGLALLA